MRELWLEGNIGRICGEAVLGGGVAAIEEWRLAPAFGTSAARGHSPTRMEDGR